jgi:hypothetical protein
MEDKALHDDMILTVNTKSTLLTQCIPADENGLQQHGRLLQQTITSCGYRISLVTILNCAAVHNSSSMFRQSPDFISHLGYAASW